LLTVPGMMAVAGPLTLKRHISHPAREAPHVFLTD
jgi:hypothetical protein